MTDTPWVLIERVAAAMYVLPDPTDPDAPIHPWPPTHPDDHAWWMAHAKAAINAMDEYDDIGPRPGTVMLPRPRPANYIERPIKES